MTWSPRNAELVSIAKSTHDCGPTTEHSTCQRLQSLTWGISKPPSSRGHLAPSPGSTTLTPVCIKSCIHYRRSSSQPFSLASSCL